MNTIVLFITLIIAFLSILSLFLNYQKKKVEEINAKTIFTKGVLIVSIFLITLNAVNPLYSYFFPAEAYNYRVNIRLRKGDKDKALADFNKAIQLNPNYAEAYYNRSVVYLNQGSNNLGCPDAQKSCELGNCKLLEIVKGKGYCR